MAKGTRADVEAQIAALQKQLEDEDGLTLVVEDDRGRKTHLTGERARRWLSKLGLDDDDDDDQGDGAGDVDDDPPPPKGKLRARFFEQS